MLSLKEYRRVGGSGRRSGGIAEAITGVPGLTDLADPLDLTERPNGDLYVAAGVSSNSPVRITLLRATP